jgi:hypothetical protein
MGSAGIDYGLGKSNIDVKTGIRYGVISQHAVRAESTDDFEYNYGPAQCPAGHGEVVSSDDESVTDEEWNDGKDFACTKCQKCYWSDSVYGDDPIGWSYEQHGYELKDCLDSDIFVLGSPFYTYAAFCSPCVPGACSLNSPLDPEVGVKCYALGHEWFDDDRAPYRVWRVADDVEVLPETGGA